MTTQVFSLQTYERRFHLDTRARGEATGREVVTRVQAALKAKENDDVLCYIVDWNRISGVGDPYIIGFLEQIRRLDGIAMDLVFVTTSPHLRERLEGAIARNLKTSVRLERSAISATK